MTCSTWTGGIFCLCLLSRSVQCGLHGDEGKVVGVWETSMSREVEGLP